LTGAKFKAILLFGGPGCGKGTQGAVLGAFPHVKHLAMGDTFRALDKNSDTGQEFLSYSTKGLLVPDELTVRVWKAHVDGLVKSGDLDPGYHTLLLDGIPRTTEQVALMNAHIIVLQTIHLVINNQETLVKRLKGRAIKSNRPDDADEQVIRERLRVYDESTAPVLESFDRSLVTAVNADQSPFAVLRDIADCLATRMPVSI
jgi:adenylate kinase